MFRSYAQLLRMAGLQDTAVHNINEDYEGLSPEVSWLECRMQVHPKFSHTRMLYAHKDTT